MDPTVAGVSEKLTELPLYGFWSWEWAAEVERRIELELCALNMLDLPNVLDPEELPYEPVLLLLTALEDEGDADEP